MTYSIRILEKWINGVNEGNIQELILLYNNNAVLIPTFSNRIMNSPVKIRNYFKKLSAKKNLSISLHQNSVIEQELTEKVFSLNGIYCWKFEVDNEILSFEARFSYVLDSTKEKPIILHHSSQIPRMI